MSTRIFQRRWSLVAVLISMLGFELGPPACFGQDSSDPVKLTDALPASALPASPAKPWWPRTWQLLPGFTFRLTGRINADSISTSQSAANEALFGPLGDVVGLRRAWIGAEGDLGANGRYVAQIDLASGTVVPRDVFVARGKRQQSGEWQFGHFREPFSLEGGTSANNFAFMERSPVNLLDPARNWGLGIFGADPGGRATWALGAFHAGTNAGDYQGGDGSTVGFTGRATTALINEGDGEQLCHLGLAVSERLPENGVIIVNQQPQSPLLDLGDSSNSAFVPKIVIPSRFQQLINVQFAAAQGSLWAQAEWYGTLIDQTGGGLVFLRGCHADCGYFLTGEHRAYQTGNGTLGAVRVNRPWLRRPAERDQPAGWGAWELAARFSYLDFVDPNNPLAAGGQRLGLQLPESTFGVNWYLSDRVRLMFNYSYALPKEVNAGTSAANIFATRLAVFW